MYPEIVRRLFIVGGSAVTCVADFLGLSGGKEANIVVLPHASSVPAEVAQEMVKTLKGLGARNVRVVMPDEKLNLDGVDAVYMLGGDQSVLVDRLGKDGVAELKRAFARGVLIAGSSAGAACVGELMISGGMPNGTWNPTTLTTRDGLGLASGLVVDTHFAQRRRFARPRAAMNQALNKGYGLLSGVGLDEDTGVLILFGERGQPLCTVYGECHVWVYEPTGRNRRVVRHNRARTVRGVGSRKYSRGESFRLKRTRAAS
jgi:cyanophycinase